MRSALALVFVFGAASAVAQANAPWTTSTATVHAGEGRIVSAHRSSIEASSGSYTSRRRAARDRARVRACASIHDAVDELLARAAVSPPEVAALHSAVDSHCEVVGVRPTIDGGAVVQVAVTFEALRAAADPEGVPW